MLRRVLTIHSAPPRIVGLTLLASCGAAALGSLQAWPLWAKVLAALFPWIPIFTKEIVWTHRHYQWLSLFYVLVVTQGGHFLEHVAQIVQIHILGLTGPAARGIFGALDIEWVHYIWNTWVIIAVLLLLYRFRNNPWLWVTGALATWHEIEHTVIMSVYLKTGLAGTPGLLARGGLIGGGLLVTRPDLHFLYNFIEIASIAIAFGYQLRRSYDESLKKAFPYLSGQLLTDLTNKLRTLRFAAGDTIPLQGAPSGRCYIIAQGEVSVMDCLESGREVEISALSPGQYFGEIGLLRHMPHAASMRAKTAVEVLVLNRETFYSVVESPDAAAEDLTRIVRDRLGHSVE